MDVLPAVTRAPSAVRPLPARPPAAMGRGRALLALGAVALGYALLQLFLTVPGTRLGWDETVYLSQVGSHAPAAFFSAPRARGISYLVAPVAAVSSSPEVVHAFLAVLAGAGMLGALWAWRRLLPVSVLALAGGLFGTLWISVFYGPEVMPNMWCALGSLAAAGCFLRTVRWPGDRRAPAGLGVSVAVVALMRPPDAFWLVLPLAAAALLVRGRRRGLLLTALAAGALVGAAPWIAEAYAHYGGLLARIHRGSEIQGGMGPHLAFGDQVRSLQGKLLCRPCTLRWREPGTAVWWFALPVLTAGGIWAAARAGRRGPAVLATLTALSMAFPYLFLMRYAAPRFLLPSYALLALAAAECLRGAGTLASRTFGDRTVGGTTVGTRRPFIPRTAVHALTAAGLAALLSAHLAVQFHVLDRVVHGVHRNQSRLAATAAQLHGLGVRPPCTLSGWSAVPLAYYAGCASQQPHGHDGSMPLPRLLSLGERQPFGLLMRDGHKSPSWARGWRVVRLPQPHYRVYLAPSTHSFSGTYGLPYPVVRAR